MILSPWFAHSKKKYINIYSYVVMSWLNLKLLLEKTLISNNDYKDLNLNVDSFHPANVDGEVK